MNPIHKDQLIGPFMERPVRVGWYLIENPSTADPYRYYVEVAEGAPYFNRPNNKVWRYWNGHCWIWLRYGKWEIASVLHGWYGLKETFPYTPARS